MPAYYHTGWQRAVGTASDRVQLLPATGPAFYLVSRPGGAVSAVENQVFTAAMDQARTAVHRAYGIVVARLAGTPAGAGVVPAHFDQLLEYCFRPGAIAATITATRTRVRDNLVRIRNGLWTPGLQIVDSNVNRGGAASGYVRCSYSELFRLRDANREQSFGGRIHIRFGNYNTANTPVNQRNAATVIVHEATHKFCGARDWTYNGGGFAGYAAFVAMGAAPPLPALTNAQGLNNADSYAELVMAM